MKNTNTRNTRKSLLLWVSFSFLIILMIATLSVSFLSPYDFDQQDIESLLLPASSAHWLGTDSLGRDLCTRILFGARTSLAVGLITAGVALLIGTLCGAIAGYVGGWIDQLLMRVADLFYLFPATLVAILIMLFLGRGLVGILAALGFSTWVIQARMTRNLILRNKELPYVESARAIGMNDRQILWKYLLPSLLGPTLVTLTFQIPNNIMAESFLSFIGLGLQPPASSWGTLASEGFRGMQSYPHLILYPGLILFLTLLSLSAVGEWLRNRLDPKRNVSIRFN